MKLSEIAQKSEMIIPQELEDLEIAGICYDSRKAGPGNIFVCIKGFKTDGHKYAAAAAANGASLIVAQDPVEVEGTPVIYAEDTRKALSSLSAGFFGHASDEMLVFGVTGTNGKTTITYLLRDIVEYQGKECGVLGTIAYVYGGETHESPNTTPESFELQRMFRDMKSRCSVDVCAMEVSSHSLALSRVDDIAFDYSIFTNLTPDHMDFHTDFEDYYQAKKKLFLQTSKMCVINIDDEYGKRLFGELTEAGIPAKSCAIDDRNADYSIEIIESSGAGTSGRMYAGNSLLGDIRINTPGRFSVSNAMCAAAASLEAGFPWEAVSGGIGRIKGVAGRFEKVENSKGITVIVDYAHTPDALNKVLLTAREFTEGRIITVFGCGGDRDRTKRPLMGQTAGDLSDVCVVTSDNPRTEDPDFIISEIIPGIEGTACSYTVQPDRRLAIKEAVGMWQKGDTVVIAGKGHEDYQIIGTTKHHFDDRETAAQIIEKEM